MMENLRWGTARVLQLFSGRAALPQVKQGRWAAARYNSLGQARFLANMAQPAFLEAVAQSRSVGMWLGVGEQVSLPKITVGGLVKAPPRYANTKSEEVPQQTQNQSNSELEKAVDQISTFKRKKAKIKRERKATVRKRLMKKSQRKREKLNL